MDNASPVHKRLFLEHCNPLPSRTKYYYTTLNIRLLKVKDIEVGNFVSKNLEKNRSFSQVNEQTAVLENNPVYFNLLTCTVIDI